MSPDQRDEVLRQQIVHDLQIRGRSRVFVSAEGAPYPVRLDDAEAWAAELRD